MKINLLTKSPFKIQTAKSVFDKYGIEVVPIFEDYPEIQADTSLEIARHTAIEASKDLNLPVLREDHSLFINTVKAPGPYMSFFEKNVPAEAILKLLKGYKDRSGYFEIATVYATPGGKTIEFVLQVPIEIEKSKKVKDAPGWSGIIRLSHQKNTLAERPESERFHCFNKNFQLIAEYLLANPNTTN